MRLVTRRDQRGDTIIEVMFAVAVFAMVAVGCLSIMNQGTATAQRSLEITLVRQQMDAQAEALRYIHQVYVASFDKNTEPTGTAKVWRDMIDNKGATVASPFGAISGSLCPAKAPGEKPFILNAQTATVQTAEPAMEPPADGSLPPFAQVAYNSDSSVAYAYGIWVEAIPSEASAETGFVDFHIRACWDSPGSRAPVTLGTIVRLYEPR